MSLNQPEVLVVGAGVCGMTVADRLAARGRRVAVVEREAQPGGLARTFDYPDGRFDIGPHRFHTVDAQVLAYLDNVLGDDVLHIPRRSLVYFLGHYYHWPIHPTLHLLRLPPRMVIGVVFDLLFRLYRQRRPTSFEDYILNMYGRTLYETFFRDYTTKFLGIAPSQTHPDWAKTGVDRAIIDERLKINTLFELIKSIFVRPRGAEILFRYPRGGVEVFSAKLAQRITAAGGQVLMNTPVTAVEADGNAVTAVLTGERRWQPERVIWTASPTALMAMLGEKPPELRFLDLICYNIVTRRALGPNFQWCYFGSPDVVFSRVSRPEGFDPGMIGEGRAGLCVEVSGNPAAWADPERFAPAVMQGLVQVGLLASPADAAAVHIEKVREAYPIYSSGYDTLLAELMNRLKTLSNVTLAGRTGTFWYNNMDHSIAMALRLAADSEPAKKE